MRRKRMDGVMEEVTKEVEVSKLVEPKFLTLTKSPANQTAFKVIRDDNGDTNMSQPAPATEPTRRRRIRSTQRSSLLFIEFPEGATDDDVNAVAEEYGLEGYEISLTSDGRKCLKRNDLSELPDNAITVTTEDGKRLGVARSDSQIPAPTADAMPFVDVVAIEFDKTVFADETVTGAYLQRYDIDFLEKGVENTDKLIRVVRSELGSGAEIRRVQVEPGVVAVVTRAATEDDLPSSKFTEVVCEECYGNWGWGQLDFNAMMADVEFCRAVDDATWRMSDLMNRILFWSELPVAARKELVNRAATQYSEYIGALLDGLPAKVILVNRSSLETKESKTMNQKTSDETLKNTATAAGEATPAQTPAATDTTDEKPITRSEVVALIAEGVAAALKKQDAPAAGSTEDTTQRSDDGKGDDASGKLLASVESVAESVKGLAASMEAMTKRMDTADEKPITRSEVVALIAEGVAAALKKPDEPAAGSTDDTTQRSDEGKGDDASGKLLASVESVAESVKGLAASMEAMTKRMDTMEGATVVRSDNADATATPTKRKDVFAGVFGPRG